MNGEIVPLKIDFDFGAGGDAIYLALLRDKRGDVLVDCGYSGFLPRIEAAVSAHGGRMDALAAVIVTHHDHDHIGALAALKAKYPHIRVYAGVGEAEYVSGRRKALRLQQAEAMQDSLPDDQKPMGEAFMAMLRCVEPVEPDVLLAPGDAMVLENSLPAVANPEFAYSLPDAQRSLKRLLALDAEPISVPTAECTAAENAKPPRFQTGAVSFSVVLALEHYSPVAVAQHQRIAAGHAPRTGGDGIRLRAAARSTDRQLSVPVSGGVVLNGYVLAVHEHPHVVLVPV